jgi:7-cyano-7-deazaguanine reductase
MNTQNTIDPKVGQVAEGKVLAFDSEDSIRTEELKTFEFNSKNQLINIKTAEFSAVCPFSGLPDIATVTIKYMPETGIALELKALKYYFLSFRNVGIYQEGVTARIFNDLKKVLGHNSIFVETTYNVRGGIDVTCIESGKELKYMATFE